MPAQVSPDELIDVQLPWRGMNSDISGSQLQQDMASLIYNYVPGEPGQMRLRNGLERVLQFNKAELTGSARGRYTIGSTSAETYASNQSGLNSITTAQPCGVAVYGTRALITYACWTDGTNQGQHGQWYYNQQHIGASNGGAQFRTMVLDLAAGTIIEPFGDGTDSGGTKRWQKIWNDSLNVSNNNSIPAVFGHGVPFDERVFFVTPLVKGHVNFKPIQSWAGAGAGLFDGSNPPVNLDASNNSVSLKINNGEKTIASNETANENTVLAKMGLLLRPYASNTTPTTSGAFWFVYKIATDPQAAALYFTQEYGRGRVASVVPNETHASNKNFCAWPVQPVVRGPWGCTSINAHQGRLFAFAGTRAAGEDTTVAPNWTTVFPNLVQWSSGNAEEWPADQYFFIDDASNDVIIGGVTVGENQLLFTRNTCYIHSGYDEDTFQLDTLMRGCGAVDSRGIRYIDDRAYWLSNDGLWSWGGRGLPKRESHPGSAVGIESELLTGPLGAVTPEKRTHNIGKVKDRVVFSVQPSLGGANMTHQWVFHPATGAFSRWGVGNYAQTYTLDATNTHKIPWMHFDANGSYYAVGGTTVWKMDNVFDPTTPSAGDATKTILSTDQYRDTSDANATDQIAARIRFRDMVVRPGRSVRVRFIHVEHAAIHTDATKNAYDIKLGVDHDLATSMATFGTGKARAETNAAGAFDQGRYFVDRFIPPAASVSLEGTVLRFQIDKDSASTYQNDGGHKLFRVYATIQVTRNSRVDSTGA